MGQVTGSTIISVLVSIVVSIPACHAGDPGSIPGRGDLFCNIYIFDWPWSADGATFFPSPIAFHSFIPGSDHSLTFALVSHTTTYTTYIYIRFRWRLSTKYFLSQVHGSMNNKVSVASPCYWKYIVTDRVILYHREHHATVMWVVLVFHLRYK